MDIRHSALGLRQQIKYISNTAIPVKTPPYYPVRPFRSARLYSQTSISTRSSLQPPRGTFTPHNTHQETEKRWTFDVIN